MKTYAIGDIHGAYRALMQCLEFVKFNYKCDRLIVLGDVCDGYPDVKQCIDELLKIKHCDLIIGNHDISILDKRNSADLTKATQDFLIGLKNTSHNEQSDYAIKTFMRIIFKSIHIYNQEIVRVELNQPWKMCYEQGEKWLKQEKTGQKAQKTTQKTKRSYVSYCAPSVEISLRFYDILFSLFSVS